MLKNQKYDNLVFIEPIVEGEFAPKIGIKDLEGTNVRLAYNYISEPFLIIDKPHKHDDDQYLCFIGGDATNIRDFQAEVELCLGDEPEKYIINKTTIVYVPAGLAHCPLNFVRVDKPVIFMDIYIGKDYEQK